VREARSHRGRSRDHPSECWCRSALAPTSSFLCEPWGSNAEGRDAGGYGGCCDRMWKKDDVLRMLRCEQGRSTYERSKEACYWPPPTVCAKLPVTGAYAKGPRVIA
jgi:hypothetical protein